MTQAAGVAHGRGQHLISGLGASATLALLNLSLLLATGALSAMPLGPEAIVIGVVAAFVSGILGGLVVTAFARAPSEIASPAASIGVIYAALAADLVARGGLQVDLGEVWAALSLCVVLMGALLLIAGSLRVAEAAKFMPLPVSAGFVTGIGLLLMWSQVGPLLGLEGRLASYDWSALVAQWKPASLVVGAVTAAVMWGYPKLTRHGQPALVAVVFGTVLYHVIAGVYGPEQLGPTLGTIAPAAIATATFDATWSHVTPGWIVETGLYVLPYAAFLALQATMNAAVTAPAVGNVLGTRSDVNRTLKAQGVANILCGVLAALPVTTSASQSLPAARMGATRALTAWACAIILAALLVAGPLLGHIPIAVLAAVLVVTGAGMMDRWARGLVTRLWGGGVHGRVAWNVLIVAAVAAAFFFGSIPYALLTGALLAMILLAVDLSTATTFGSHDAVDVTSQRVWPPEQARWLAGERARVRILRPRGALFFGTADQLAALFDAVEAGTKYCVLDMARLTTLDATACQVTSVGARRLAGRGVVTVLAGHIASSPHAQELIALGLTHPDPATHWFEDVDHALEWIEGELLGQRFPGADADPSFDIATSPLTKDLSAAELETLRATFRRVEVREGVLFRSGDPGDSMYVVASGLVEIRIGGAAHKSTRLAAFGRGAIFGEIAMLTYGRRTADAVCVEPTVLYELTRAALAELGERLPRLHARILANLNAHLANRLVIATRIVEAYQ